MTDSLTSSTRNTTAITPAADFQALPLEMIIATPLVAAVKAQSATAQATLAFIKGLMNEKKEAVKDANGAIIKGSDDKPLEIDVLSPVTAHFNLQYEETVNDKVVETKKVRLDTPLLAMVPIPNLRIDSLTTHFKYEITQVISEKEATQKGVEFSVNAGTSLLPFLQATVKGNASSSSSTESTTNRSGVLEITVHASEAPIPEGLARLLSTLAKMAEPKVITETKQASASAGS